MRLLSSSLENFKIYSKHEIDLTAPLTLLVGPNSSGKSSVIKSILGIKQSFSHANEGEALASFGDYVDLGTYFDYVHNHDLGSEIMIGYTFDFDDDSPSKSLLINSLINSGKIDHFSIHFIFDYDYSTEQARIKRLLFGVASKKYTGDIFTISRKTTRSSYRLALSPDFTNSKIASAIDFIMPDERKYWLREASVEHLSRFQFIASSQTYIADDLMWLANDTMTMLSRYFDREIYYIGPLRRSPSRSYIRTTHNIAVGPTGEHTPSVLASLEKRKKKATRGISKVSVQAPWRGPDAFCPNFPRHYEPFAGTWPSTCSPWRNGE